MEAIVWVPGIEPGTFVRGASVLNHLTLEPQAPDFFVIVVGGGSSFKVNGIRLRPTELLFFNSFLYIDIFKGTYTITILPVFLQ